MVEDMEGVCGASTRHEAWLGVRVKATGSFLFRRQKIHGVLHVWIGILS